MAIQKPSDVPPQESRASDTTEFWTEDMTQAAQLARETDRPMLVHFHAPGCGPCRRMEAEVLSNPEIMKLAGDYYIPVKVDGAQYPALASRFYVRSYPTDYILTSEGKMVSRVVGLQTLEGYRTFLSEAAERMQFHVAEPHEVPETPEVAVVPEASEVVDATLPALELPPFPGGALLSTDERSAENSVPDLGEIIEEIEGNLEVGTTREMEPPSVVDAAPTEVIEELQTSPYHRDAPVVVAEVQEAVVQEIPTLLDGYCPVALVERNTWVKGDPSFGVRHRGCLYLFEDQSAMDRFFQNPDHYALASEGLDVVLWSEHGERTVGARNFGLRYDGMNFVFANETTREKFRSDPERYAREIRQAIIETARLRGRSQ